MERHEFEQYFSKDGKSFFAEEDKANVEYVAATSLDSTRVREFVALVAMTNNLEGKLSGRQEIDDCIFTLDDAGKSISLRVKPQQGGTFYAVRSVDEFAKTL